MQARLRSRKKCAETYAYKHINVLPARELCSGIASMQAHSSTLAEEQKCTETYAHKHINVLPASFAQDI
jgi:hypothetical protein